MSIKARLRNDSFNTYRHVIIVEIYAFTLKYTTKKSKI